MVYCSVHGCSNEQGKSQSKVDGRRFLRFFKLPKDARLAKDWKHRMRRRPEDITDKMVVCSDHFADDDFSNKKLLLKLMYLPKSTGFGMTTTIVMTMLTAIQNNCYLDSTNKLKTYSVRQWSRANKEHILKDRNVYDSVSFKKKILEETFDNIRNKQMINLDLSSYIRQPIPKTFHCQTAPSKEELLEKKNSRMNK